jgi:hypothetical protein
MQVFPSQKKVTEKVEWLTFFQKANDILGYLIFITKNLLVDKNPPSFKLSTFFLSLQNDI